MDDLKIYVISDSIGETAQRMIQATLTQFPTIETIEIKKFSFIHDKESFVNILNLAKKNHAIIVTTIVDEEFNVFAREFCEREGVSYIDYMTSLIHVIQDRTGLDHSWSAVLSVNLMKSISSV